MLLIPLTNATPERNKLSKRTSKKRRLIPAKHLKLQAMIVCPKPPYGGIVLTIALAIIALAKRRKAKKA